MNTKFAAPVLAVCFCLAGGWSVETAGADDDETNMRFNLPIKTGGGTQFWTDRVYRSGYRIQQHALTGHWRLIDDADVRRAWGTRDECLEELGRLKPIESVGATSSPKHVIVLLHGLMRTHHSMKPLEAALAKTDTPDVVRFSYASSRSSIGDSAAALREVLQGMPAETTFSFIGHSMGNIVVRHLIGDLTCDGDAKGLLPRFESMVMLGPPNQGAAIARRLAPTGVYGWVTGKGGMELGAQWNELQTKLATPPFPFIIIAGDVSENKIQNPLVDGSGDFVVSLEEATLDGAAALHTVPVLHSFLMNDPAAIKLTLDFLRSSRSEPKSSLP